MLAPERHDPSWRSVLKPFRDGGELSAFLRGQKAALAGEVENEGRNELLNANEADYIPYLVSKHTISSPTLHQSDLFISNEERDIPAEKFPEGFYVRSGERYRRLVITYHLPFAGNSILMNLHPSRWSTAPLPEILVRGSEITFEIVNWHNNPERITETAKQAIDALEQMLGFVREETNAFNESLPEFAGQCFAKRKAALLDQAGFLANLGVPLREGTNSAIVSVPFPQEKLVISKPIMPSTAFAPEPVLSDTTYRRILEICYSVGVAMERTPCSFAPMNEADYRNMFLMTLSSHFESTTGETFNNKGKTDILVRYQGKNAFVAECKIWSGKKNHHRAIDQILSYLTWRDSKAAIFYFVRNCELSEVLSQIVERTPSHVEFARMVGRPQEAWLDFRFRLPRDTSREVHLAVLAFHFRPNQIPVAGKPQSQE
jgi:hypothetical protein